MAEAGVEADIADREASPHHHHGGFHHHRHGGGDGGAAAAATVLPPPMVMPPTPMCVGGGGNGSSCGGGGSRALLAREAACPHRLCIYVCYNYTSLCCYLLNISWDWPLRSAVVNFHSLYYIVVCLSGFYSIWCSRRTTSLYSSMCM